MASTAKKNHTDDSRGRHGNATAARSARQDWADFLQSTVEITPKDYRKWRSYLANRRKPVPPRKLFANVSTAPLSWGLSADIRANSELLEVVRGTSKLKRKSGVTNETVLRDWLEPWLAERDPDVSRLPDALECLAWAYAAPQLVTHLEAGPWQDLMRQLIHAVRVARDGHKQPTQGLIHLLLAGELPLVLAYQFPELSDCRELAKPASKFVSQCLEQWLDGHGMPHANHLANIRPLVASFTRSIRLARETENAKIRKSALAEFDWLVQHALRLTRTDLTTALTSRTESTHHREFSDMFHAALLLTDDACDLELLRAVLHANAPKAHDPPRDGDLPDEPSYQSDWSECAVLQTEWSPKEPRMIVTHANRKVTGELSVGKDIVFAGDLTPTISIDGNEMTFSDDWECVCWFSDHDVDLLELRSHLHGGWRVERQMLLAREDKFLLMSDVVIGNEKARIECCSSLPLGEGITFDPAPETHDGFLAGKRKSGLVLPLGLPEWRSETRGGTMVELGNRLELRHATEASALYAPLFIDLHRRRMRLTPTWRQLTVAEDLQIVPRDQAVGFRVHVGIEQWLIYRSLRPTISRTVWGQHLACEFLCGRFLNDGTIEPLVEIANDDTESSA